MEKFLNDLGKDEWEIIAFHTQPDNLLAFTGLARRSTQRDWTLARRRRRRRQGRGGQTSRRSSRPSSRARPPPRPAAEERPESVIAEKAAPEDGFRKPIDTSRDDDPDAPEEEKDEWDKLGEEDELPTFFEAIRPHMRRNQRGPGMSVGVDYLAKKWDLSEDDIKGALVECGFALPDDEDTKPVYLEYDGDLYWLNINRRGELWLNTKEKPRPVFRAVQGQRVTVEEPAEKPDNGNRKPDRERHERSERPERAERPEPVATTEGSTSSEASPDQTPKTDTPSAPLATGSALLGENPTL